MDAVAVVRSRHGGPPPTGYVQFYAGAEPAGPPVRLDSGRAAYTHWTSTTPGDYTFRAVYLGDTRHGPARLPVRTVTIPGN